MIFKNFYNVHCTIQMLTYLKFEFVMQKAVLQAFHQLIQLCHVYTLGSYFLYAVRL